MPPIDASIPALSFFWSTIVPLVLTFIMAWIGKEAIPLLRRLAEKYKLDISSITDQQLLALAEKWVRFAESTIEAKYKGKSVKGIQTGPEKMAVAVAGITCDAPDVTPGEAEVLAEAVLNRLGDGKAENFGQPL